MPDNEFEIIKETLREKAREQRATVDGAARIDAAKAAAAHFGKSVPLSGDAVVAAYWPIRDELDSKPLLLEMMDAGRTVCLPVIMGDARPLVFKVWEPDAPLFESGFGTLAPSELAPDAVPDVVIIPLLGFDRAGTRLGYGRGYYDRTIAAMETKPLMVGYAFSAQELPEIPREDHDVPLDFLVTEAGVRRFDN